MRWCGYRTRWTFVALTLLCAVGSRTSRADTSAVDQVAELLDALIQPRFQKDGGVFGMRRVVRSPGHEEVGALTDLSAWDKKQLAHIVALKHDYRVGMLRIKHPPGRYRKGQGAFGGLADTIVSERGTRNEGYSGPRLFTMIGPEFEDPASPGIRKAALAAFPQAVRQGTATETVGNWKVTLRPVRATKPSCINCHRGSRAGDALGVLVYAVDQRPKPVPAPASSRRK